MKNYRAVTMNDKTTGEILFFCLLFKQDRKWYPLVEGDKVKEFKTRKEAKEYGDRFFNSENPNSVSNQPTEE
jgi:hypothetical protein